MKAKFKTKSIFKNFQLLSIFSVTRRSRSNAGIDFPDVSLVSEVTNGDEDYNKDDEEDEYDEDDEDDEDGEDEKEEEGEKDEEGEGGEEDEEGSHKKVIGS